jgi:eukaryotic-like serine/threonine-protein kinase
VPGRWCLKRLNRAAVRVFEDAFAAKPTLAINLGAFHRYNAACAAALAGCGQGKDADKLAGMERGRLRGQAVDWLLADRDDWRRLVDKQPERIRAAIAGLTRQSQEDVHFTGVRGLEALAKLPETEREPWQGLCGDLANTLGSAQANTTPEKKSAAK